MAALLFVAFFLSSFKTVCEVRAHFQWMKSRDRKAARSSDVRIWNHKWSMPIGQAIVMRPSDFLQKCESWNMLKNSALATWSGGPEMSTVQSHQILHLRRKRPCHVTKYCALPGKHSPRSLPKVWLKIRHKTNETSTTARGRSQTVRRPFPSVRIPLFHRHYFHRFGRTFCLGRHTC